LGLAIPGRKYNGYIILLTWMSRIPDAGFTRQEPMAETSMHDGDGDSRRGTQKRRPGGGRRLLPLVDFSARMRMGEYIDNMQGYMVVDRDLLESRGYYCSFGALSRCRL
jgi:hypothetical protein